MVRTTTQGKDVKVELPSWDELSTSKKKEELFTNILSSERTRWKWSKFDTKVIKQWDEIEARLEKGQSMSRVMREMFGITGGSQFQKLQKYIQEIMRRKRILAELENKLNRENLEREQAALENERMWCVYKYVKAAKTIQQQWRRIEILNAIIDKSTTIENR